jgi:hypothetical protein
MRGLKTAKSKCGIWRLLILHGGLRGRRGGWKFIGVGEREREKRKERGKENTLGRKGRRKRMRPTGEEEAN